MKHIIYNTETACLARIAQADEQIRPTWTDNGKTVTYAQPRKHPTENLWALVIEPIYEYVFTAEEIANAVELDESWNPKMEFPI